MDQLAENVLGWLRKGGFPLEYETARLLRSAGFRAEQGRHYIDPLTAQNREVDVLARLDPDAKVPVVLVFECKAMADKPWVVLTTDIHPEPTVPVAGRSLQIVLEQPGISEWMIRDTLPLPHPYGYTVVEAHSDKNDRAHAALQQSLSSSVGIQEALQKAEQRSLMVLPVVVTEAPLLRFESHDGNHEVVKPTRWERIRWNGSQAHPHPTIVDVVKRDGLRSYLSTVRGQVSALQKT